MQLANQLNMSGGDNFANEICVVLKDLRKKQQLCDGVILTADGRRFAIHRSILAAASPFLRAVFTNSMSCGDSVETNVENVTSDIMTFILDFVYTGNLTVTSENVEKLLPAVDELLMDSAKKQCEDFLIQNLTVENCVGIYRFSQYYCCSSLFEASKSFILANFLQIYPHSEEFFQMSPESLKSFLEDDHLNIRKEENVFEAIMMWIQFDEVNRRQYLGSLLRCIRFAYCPYGFIMGTILRHPYITEKELFQASKCEEDVNGNITVRVSSLRPRIPNEILFVFGGWSCGNATRLVETYDARANKWLLPRCTDRIPRAYHAVVQINRLIYVVGGFDGYYCFSSTRCFDPFTNIWSEKACMHYARCYVSGAHLDGLLYAMGGFDGRQRTNSCESYDPRQNQWTVVANMNQQRSDASAASLNGKLYIAGGFNGREVLSTAEMYDPKINIWTYIRPMLFPRSGVSLVNYKGFLYAIGGFDGADRLSAVEKYSQLLDEWIQVPSMINQRSNFTAQVLEDLLFVIGGFDGSTTVALAESYNEKDSTWKSAPSMNINRSALSSCVVKGLPNAADYTFLGSKMKFGYNSPERWCADLF